MQTDRYAVVVMHLLGKTRSSGVPSRRLRYTAAHRRGAGRKVAAREIRFGDAREAPDHLDCLDLSLIHI